VLNNKKKGLGKGMGSLIDGYSLESVLSNKSEEKTENEYKQNVILHVLLSQIKTNHEQPRKHFDEESLNELAQSVKEYGILQPILVEELSANKYLIIAGERRFRAAKKAGLERVPVIIKKFNDFNKLEIALIENIQRENLDPIEEAVAYSFLIQESGITQEDLSKKIGKSRSAISNSIRLLQLPKEFQDGLINGEYSAGHARAILSLVNPSDRVLLLEKLKKNKISVREAEKIAKDLNNGRRDGISKKSSTESKKNNISEELLEIQDKFIETLGNKVEIKGDISKGKIMLSYNSVKELEVLFHRLSEGRDLFEI